MGATFFEDLEVERSRLNSMFPNLLVDLLTEEDTQDIPRVLMWLKEVYLYNVPHGKQIRGVLVPFGVKTLSPNSNEALVKQAYILGCCIEILQASCLVADDIMDNGEMRRGKPCWYKVDDLGSLALNDALLLEHMVYRLLAKHFKGASFFNKLSDLFHDVAYKTILGQCLDTQSGRDGKFLGFTMENYEAIVKYKTSYYTFYLPIALATTVVECGEDSLMKSQLEQFALKLGYLFQVQDDFLHCFGTEDQMGKIGSDIQNGKCTWLFIFAKEKSSPSQLNTLLENYGCGGEKEVSLVKKLYDDLNVRADCIEHMKSVMKEVYQVTECVENKRLQTYLEAIADMMIRVG